LKNRQNLRVVQIIAQNPAELEFKQIMGGILFQTTDQIDQEGDDINNWKLVSGREVSIETKNDLSFAWRVAKDVKSNAIVIARNLATVGIGMGQTNRVDSVKQAIGRAGVRSKGAVIASDGFFPFADSIELIKKAEISAIVQPGGSIKDSEVIKACIDAEISMYLTGVRHFLH
jgi:phosphoribosylaminoimidazolecarboxamide formyltransferase/IMP cyclohydrolase